MSIQKDKNGTYMVQYEYYDPVSNVRKKTKKRGFKTKSAARIFEASLSVESSDVLFYTLYIEYQNTLEQNDNTRTEKNRLIERYIPDFMTVMYKDLTKPYLLKVRADIGSLDLSPIRKNKIISLIKSTCRYANEIYDLKDNSKVLKTFKKDKTSINIWSFGEYFSFEQCLPKKYVPFFHLMFFTGMRKGEARALLVDDLDIENGVITINKSMRKGIPSLGATKTESSVRKVQLDTNTLELLKPLKSNEKWLFGDYKPLGNSTIDRVFKEAIEKAGVKKIRIHDLRHSHCSYLIGNGIDVVSVANRLGHSNVNTTLSTYSHALENADNKIVDFLNGSQKVAKGK